MKVLTFCSVPFRKYEFVKRVAQLAESLNIAPNFYWNGKNHATEKILRNFQHFESQVFSIQGGGFIFFFLQFKRRHFFKKWHSLLKTAISRASFKKPPKIWVFMCFSKTVFVYLYRRIVTPDGKTFTFLLALVLEMLYFGEQSAV